MKISVLTSRQSSVMMLMFRFSQEFPRKGNDKAVTRDSPIFWCTLQPAGLPIPLANTQHLQLQGTALSFALTPIRGSH